jgi:hypothetical protein
MENNGKARSCALAASIMAGPRLDLKASALRLKAAVRPEVQVKRQRFRRTGPSGRKMLRRPPLPRMK